MDSLFEDLLYEQLCRGCMNEKKRHDDCEHCDTYLERLEEEDDN